MALKKSGKKKKNVRNTIIALAIIIIAVLALVFAAKYLKPRDKIAANVNGDVIMKEDVLRIYLNVPPEYRTVITAQSILEGMIIERLLVQESEKQGISVPDELVDGYVESLLATYDITEENLTQTLDESGLTLEALKTSFKEKMMINELLNQTIFSSITVYDEDVEAYYNENIEQFTEPEEVKASHIVLNNSEDAESIRKKALGGAVFAELAKKYSIGPSGPRGGTLGWFSRGEMVKEFEDAAFALKVGAISKVVETSYGFHIIKVTDRKEAVVRPLDNALREEIRYALQQQKEAAAINIYTAQLEAAADIEIFMTYKEEKEPDIVARVKKSVSTAAPEEEEVPEVTETAPVEEETEELEEEPAAEEEEDAEETTLAKCMTSKGAKMYGSETSSTSTKQKELFGDEFKDIDYIDCSTQKDACKESGVISYPTWIINGKKHVGKYSLERLAELSSC